MAKTFQLTVARVGQNFFDGEAASVTLPGADGVMTILANHEAFVSPLGKGDAVVVSAAGESFPIAIEGGIVEVSKNQVTVLL
ncbi:F0F1 ATP synthase subunit epsilon [Patescibacteria group bacterium]|nr:F0F1 ATP synthase subunit epsilon [Patescibacteria group bacterium]MBU1754677.1 F0F1 ATP synthase subunit epsilon [Patescibacteria group bacterium]